jgi:hypothetical protein
MFRPIASILTLTLLVTGCFPPPRPKPDIAHRDPSLKIPGMKQAVRLEDHQAVAQLVADLSSDDPAVRFYAIEALERLTGERLGYIYYADELANAPAIARWQEWLKQQQTDNAEHSASSQPSR